MMRAALSLIESVVGRSYFFSKHGRTHDGKRNLDNALGRAKHLDVEDFRGRWRRNGIARRVIEAAPKATWAEGIRVQEDEDQEIVTPFEEAAAALFTRLKLMPRLRQVDILAGIGEYAVLLIGGQGKEKELESELSLAEEGPFYLTPLGQDHAKIAESEEDTESERHGLPTIYDCTFDFEGSGKKRGRSQTAKIRVHHSRVIHIARDAVESDVYGTPVLEDVWDFFDDLIKIVGGGSEANWKNMDPGRLINIDKDLPVTEADVAKLKEELLTFAHDPQQKELLLRGAKLDQLEVSVAQFGPNARFLIELIAGSKEIPQRILLGTERGELASGQDERNWNRRIEERRSQVAELWLRDFVDRMIEHGALPEPPDGYAVIWPSASEMDEAEKAEVAAKLADANQKQSSAGDTLIVPSAEMRRDLWGREPLDEEPDAEPRELRGSADEETDDPPESPEWQAVAGAADAGVSAIAALWTEAWAAAREGVTESELTAALSPIDTGSVLAASEISDGEERAAELDILLDGPLGLVDVAIDAARDELQPELADLHLAVMEDAATRAIAVYEGRGSFFAASRPGDRMAVRRAALTIAFDEVNERAVEFAASQAAARFTEIDTSTRLAARELIVSRLKGELSHAQVVRELRSSLGLHTRYANAVVRLGERLAEAKPGSTVKAGSKVIKVPKGGASDAFIARKKADYTKRLELARATTAARTSAQHMANGGLRETWLQAREAGSLPADVKRTWIHSGAARPRPEHLAIDGEIRGLEESFSTGTEPGEEPNCGCGQGLVRGDG